MGLRRVRRYITGVCTPGHLPADPSARAFKIGRVCWRALVFLQVGPIRVIGKERVPPRDSVFIVASNHTHYIDPCVLQLGLGLPILTRYFVARGVLSWGRGAIALVLGPLGAVCVDLDSRGGAALRAGLRLLRAGQRLVVFPEGWAHMDGARSAFKPGAVYLATRASRERGVPVPIVPICVSYPRHPGAWIRGLPPWGQWVVTLLAFPIFRRGATVTVGEPLSSDTLPADVRAATRHLEETIRGLDRLRRLGKPE